jgi:DNA repair photolyase
MSSISLPIQGRGTAENPPNRFEPIAVEHDGDQLDEDLSRGDVARPRTNYLKDTARTIIAHNDSPDVGFEFSINPYRGCEHGCIYCYARPTHEWFGLSAGLDFETNIFVKTDAPELLRREMMAKKWRPTQLAISGVTDCYQPAERHFRLTRKCVEVCAEFRNPVGIITKSHLITRDVDVLSDMARQKLAIAILSVTTLDHELAARLEPRAASPTRRLDAIRQLSSAGVPTGVMVAPLIPGLTDHEMPAILQACADNGATFCGYVPVRLPFAVKELFESWLEQHYPDRKNKVLNRIRAIRDGKLNNTEWHERMRGTGAFADQFKAMFDIAKRKAGLDGPGPETDLSLFRRPGDQMALFSSSMQ